MILLQLFYEFFLIGLFAVGGGMATIPFLQDVSARTGWFTLAELANMTAVAESTPGPIGINIATYAGYKTAGVAGGVAAVLGVATPSVVIILIIARFMLKFRENRYVDAGFRTMRPAACALIASAGVNLMRAAVFAQPFDWRAAALFAALLVPMIKTKWHPLAFIAAGAAAGIVMKL